MSKRKSSKPKRPSRPQVNISVADAGLISTWDTLASMARNTRTGWLREAVVRAAMSRAERAIELGVVTRESLARTYLQAAEGLDPWAGTFAGLNAQLILILAARPDFDLYSQAEAVRSVTVAASQGDAHESPTDDAGQTDWDRAFLKGLHDSGQHARAAQHRAACRGSIDGELVAQGASVVLDSATGRITTTGDVPDST